VRNLDPNRLYSIPAAADVLGVSHRWVQTALKSGCLTGIRVSNNAQLRIVGAELIRLTRPKPAART
jgi:hypothetical protein